ncbi:MAG: serine/threonine-protein kinase, partial [Gemmatimonadales bacterium]
MPTLLERLREALRPDYDVEHELASGGMGVVFLARDVVLDRRVAIKIMRPELATARAGAQFLREARLLAKLSHPNVVPIHRAGEADGLLYYVMDYIEGKTLADRLDHGPLSAREVVKIGRDVLDALEAIHDLGIVHRDVKPENVFVLDDRALLADLGVAVEAAPAPRTSAQGRRPAGTPGYIAPEQWTTGAVTPQTDLYALGVTLSEAFAGRRWDSLDPSRDTDWVWVPRPYQRILRRAVQHDPGNRWPDAVSFRHALGRTRRRAVRALV